MKKNKTYIHAISNLVIVCVLIFFVILAFSNPTQNVFNTNTNQAIYNGNRNTNMVSLMINVYWGTEYIPEMLDILQEYNITTTFFVGGQWAEKEHEILQLIINNGHEIGNHGYFHRDHDTLSYSQNYEEISVTHTLVKTLTGIDMNLFAPPSGAYNQSTLDVAQELGYKTIMWSKDTIDWRDKDSQLVFSRATNNVVGGDLILMHPTEHTMQALPDILKYYANNDLMATFVSNLL